MSWSLACGPCGITFWSQVNRKCKLVTNEQNRDSVVVCGQCGWGDVCCACMGTPGLCVILNPSSDYTVNVSVPEHCCSSEQSGFDWTCHVIFTWTGMQGIKPGVSVRRPVIEWDRFHSWLELSSCSLSQLMTVYGKHFKESCEVLWTSDGPLPKFVALLCFSSQHLSWSCRLHLGNAKVSAEHGYPSWRLHYSKSFLRLQYRACNSIRG